MQQVVIIFLLYDTAGPSYSALVHSVVAMSRNVERTGQEAFWSEWSVAVPLRRHQPFDSVSAFSVPPLFAVFVWCYFSRKRQTPLSSGSAVLLRAIHACCRAHRVKHNKARPLFTSGTNHPDGTSINPPPCRQWLECTYVWPWTIQMRQRKIEWGCTEAIFSLARWPLACSRLLSFPHLLLVMCQQLGESLHSPCSGFPVSHCTMMPPHFNLRGAVFFCFIFFPSTCFQVGGPQ